MTAWELWIGMARESQEAAAGAHASGLPRSAVSRYYYAAYQAVTAVLLYKGVTLPTVDGVLREAWSHADTPRLFVQQLEPLVRDRDRRNDVAQRLTGLYEARVAADYSARATLTPAQVDGLRRDAGYIVKTAERILLGGL